MMSLDPVLTEKSSFESVRDMYVTGYKPRKFQFQTNEHRVYQKVRDYLFMVHDFSSGPVSLMKIEHNWFTLFL